jgi:glycolate oxidase iron-sulfur subunit
MMDLLSMSRGKRRNRSRDGASALLLERKVRHIISTGADVLATSNPGCHLQIASGLRSAGSHIELVQPVTLLARAYRTEIQTSLTS